MAGRLFAVSLKRLIHFGRYLCNVLIVHAYLYKLHYMACMFVFWKDLCSNPELGHTFICIIVKGFRYWITSVVCVCVLVYLCSGLGEFGGDYTEICVLQDCIEKSISLE